VGTDHDGDLEFVVLRLDEGAADEPPVAREVRSQHGSRAL
jgi:hypothetical protein